MASLADGQQKGVDRYVLYSISLTQRDVAKTFQNKDVPDPLAESDALDGFAESLKKTKMLLTE